MDAYTRPRSTLLMGSKVSGVERTEIYYSISLMHMQLSDIDQNYNVQYLSQLLTFHCLNLFNYLVSERNDYNFV